MPENHSAMKRNSCILLVLILISACAEAQKKELTLKDIWASRQFFTRSVSGFRSLPDGLRFTEMVVNDSSQTTDLVIVDFKTGRTLDTLVKGSQLKVPGAVKPLAYSNYAVNDNQSKVIFTCDEEPIYRHSTRANYWVYDISSQTLVPVSTQGKQLYATLSPKGNRVAFVRENNLYLKDLDTGEETAVTRDGKKNEIINGANDWVYEEEFAFSRAYEWSPDGSRLAWYRFDETRVPEYTLTLYDNLYPTLEKYKYPKAGETNSEVTILLYDMDGRKTTRADIGGEADQYIPRIKWTQDPEKFSVQRLNRQQNKLELLLVDARSGRSAVLLTEENKSYVEVNDDLTFLKDNKHFIWTSTRDGYRHIYYYRMDGKLEKQVTSGNWDVTSFYGWDDRTNTCYFQSAEKGPEFRQVYAVSLSGKKKLLSPADGTNAASFSATFDYFLNSQSGANTPGSYTLYEKDGRPVRVLEENKPVKEAMDRHNLVKKEFFTFETSEGLELHGWMMKPPDFNGSKKYPVLQYMYGGPGKQTVTDEWGGPDYFWFQLLAQKGYMVVSVDNRGTRGRGEVFLKCTQRNLGHLEVLDQIEVARYLGSLPYVDAARIGVFGWSYGGYLSSLLMTKGADYFKAGIAVAPVTNWRYYDSIYTERFLETPQENPKGYDENSPVNFAGLLKGRFLLVHGMADDNVHVQNSMELVNALVKEGKQFDLFFYPNKAHSLSGARLHLYTKMTDFLLENL